MAQVNPQLAVLLWFASLFGPVYEWRPEEMMHGYKVLYVTLISDLLLRHHWAVAVLANFTHTTKTCRLPLLRIANPCQPGRKKAPEIRGLC